MVPGVFIWFLDASHRGQSYQAGGMDPWIGWGLWWDPFDRGHNVS